MSAQAVPRDQQKKKKEKKKRKKEKKKSQVSEGQRPQHPASVGSSIRSSLG
jgi:hypothetical protein